MSSITGALLTEENGAYPLLGMMLFSSLMALAAALYVLWVDRIEEPERLNSSTGLGGSSNDA